MMANGTSKCGNAIEMDVYDTEEGNICIIIDYQTIFKTYVHVQAFRQYIIWILSDVVRYVAHKTELIN